MGWPGLMAVTGMRKGKGVAYLFMEGWSFSTIDSCNRLLIKYESKRSDNVYVHVTLFFEHVTSL